MKVINKEKGGDETTGQGRTKEGGRRKKGAELKVWLEGGARGQRPTCDLEGDGEEGGDTRLLLFLGLTCCNYRATTQLLAQHTDKANRRKQRKT